MSSLLLRLMPGSIFFMKYNYQNKGTLHRFEKVIGKKFPDKVVVVPQMGIFTPPLTYQIGVLLVLTILGNIPI